MKRLKKLRRRYLLLSIFSSVIIPVVIVTIKFKLYNFIITTSVGITVSRIGIIAIIILLFVGFKKITYYLKNMEYSFINHFVIGFYSIILMAIVFGLFYGLYLIIDDLLFILGWTFVCNIPTLLIFRPIWHNYNYLIKREERVEDIRRGVSK